MVDIERYSRQIMLNDIGEEGQKKLANASVLIVGVGGLGAVISLYLTGAGIGRIGLIDNDLVSISNLQRQILYSEADEGTPKVICAKKRLNELNSNINIITHFYRLDEDNAADVIDGYDIVIDGSDNFATRYLLNDTCIKLNKPYVYGAVCEYIGNVSVFYYQGGASYRDVFPNETNPNQIFGLFGVLPAIIGSIEANEVIKIITGIGEVLSNKLFTLDLLTLKSHIFDIKK
jgi:adenylyltransferase/sulfurtransferase